MQAQVFDCIRDPVCVIDTAGNILLSNPCFKDEVVRSFPNFLVDIVMEEGKQEVADALAAVHAATGSVRLQAIKIRTFAGEHQCKTVPHINPILHAYSRRCMRLSDYGLQINNLASYVSLALPHSLLPTSTVPTVRLIDWSIGILDEHLVLSGRFLDNNAINDRVVSEVTTQDKQTFQVTSSEFLDFFQRAPIALHWLSGTGHVLWANDTELQSLGYTAEEYVGHCITEFLCEGEEAQLGDVFRRLARGETIRNAAFRFRAKCGEIKYLVVDSNVNFNEDGSFRHTRCFIRNDNERRVREAVLETDRRLTEAAAKAKDKFIRRVFHEVQTPLHVLSGMMSEQEVNDMSRSLDVIIGIVADLNFATSFSANKITELVKKPTHLGSMLADVVDAVKTVEMASNVRLAIADGVPVGVKAETVLHRVLFNLTSNALRFSPPGSEVELSVTQNHESSMGYMGCGSERGEEKGMRFRGAEGVTFAVSNTSTLCVDVVEIHRYFRSYYHSDEMTACRDLSSSKGLGLGLYVAFHLVQLMGGMLEVSVTEGRNIRFSFTLPLEACELAEPSDLHYSEPSKPSALRPSNLGPRQAPLLCNTSTPRERSLEKTAAARMHIELDETVDEHVVDSGGGGAVSVAEDPGNMPRMMRILVVDDSPICQKMATKVLCRHNFATDVANNGREAVKKLAYKPCL
jgi:PAS domain S-box-containing protein